ncbi:MAG: hypothetical protein R3E97_22480 [Candidatus Eisenbacteria bacterium]
MNGPATLASGPVVRVLTHARRAVRGLAHRGFAHGGLFVRGVTLWGAAFAGLTLGGLAPGEPTFGGLALGGLTSRGFAPGRLAAGCISTSYAAESPAPCRSVILVSVRDAATDRPISLVDLRLSQKESEAPRSAPDEGRRRYDAFAPVSLQSNEDGNALLRRVCPGPYEIEARHVGYEPFRIGIRVPSRDDSAVSDDSAVRGDSAVRDDSAVGDNSAARDSQGAASTDGSGPDTVRVEVALHARVFQVGEVDVHAETVAPTADVSRGSLAVPRAATELFVGHDLIDAVAVVPGVLVTGERIYIRGLEQTHVTATVDGVPATDPVSGRWILPPPQSLSGAEVVASAMVSESVPAIGGLLAMQLASGVGPLRGKLVYGSDRVGTVPSDARDTDTVTLSISGETPIYGLSLSAAYRGTATNGPLSYDRALVSQSFLGSSAWGKRMQGQEGFSAKLSWSRPRTWRVDGAVVTTDEKRKAYHHHYSRSGWVTYVESLDEYSEFVEGEPDPDDVFYEGPRHVPTETLDSTLLFLNGSFQPWTSLDLGLRVFHTRHESEVALDSARFRDPRSLIEWWRESITRANHQVGWFFAVQGDLPTFRWSKTRETGASLVGTYRPSDAHRLRFGLSETRGRHWLVKALDAPEYYYGSFDESLGSRDVSSYVEETWRSDAHSWLRLSLRQLTRKLTLSGGSVERTRFAPAIAFHQPMSATDALNVEVGQTYQFPVLENSFLASTVNERIPNLGAERARYVELGVQRYFSRQLVAYVGAHLREYADVVFRENSVPDYAAILPPTESTPYSLSTREILTVLDYQFGTRLIGQSSLVLSERRRRSRRGRTTKCRGAAERTPAPGSATGVRGVFPRHSPARGTPEAPTTSASSHDARPPSGRAAVSRVTWAWTSRERTAARSGSTDSKPASRSATCSISTRRRSTSPSRPCSSEARTSSPTGPKPEIRTATWREGRSTHRKTPRHVSRGVPGSSRSA